MNRIKSLFVVTLTVLLNVNFSFGQAIGNQSCKIEFYLLKNVIPNADKTTLMKGKINVTVADLEEKAFVSDADIDSCFISKDSTRSFRMFFRVSDSAANRLKSLNLPLCCGNQFAVVVNGKICFTGYFWNMLSSFGCSWITAYARGNSIMLLPELPSFDLINPSASDLRKNKFLLDCLTSTNRLVGN